MGGAVSGQSNIFLVVVGLKAARGCRTIEMLAGQAGRCFVY